jgi:uncharacterized membrane protein
VSVPGPPRVNTNIITAERSHFTGPIPPPELLLKYAEIEATLPGRIIRLAENQAEHRQDLERRVIKGDQLRANCGLACGFLLGILGLFLGYLLILNNHAVAGSVFAGGSLTTLVGVFVYGTQSRKAERQRRDTQNRQQTQ